MPYIIKKFDGGYKVCLKSNPEICFSKKPIPKERALKQLIALNIRHSQGIMREKIEIAKQLKESTREELINDFAKLRDIKAKDINENSNIGNKFLDYYFFPYRLDTIGNKGINFYEFLKDDELRKSGYWNSFKEFYKGKNISDIKIKYNFYRLYYSSIAQFKPIIAKKIYLMFSPSCVLDFSAGWGGRLLAAMTIPDLKYIGFDTNTNLKKPYGQLIKDLHIKDRVKMIFKDSAKADFAKYDYDMVFTSPPYYTIEKYNDMPDYESYDDWLNRFLFPVVTNSYNNMKPKGTYILNISTKIYESIISILGKANIQIPLKISTRNLKAKTTATYDYSEYIYVWKKGA
jgi:16S rRNA G966 N2-methylase RsmD